MDFAMVGGDARFGYLTRLLCACGWDARWVLPLEEWDAPTAEVEQLPEAKTVLMNWPTARGGWTGDALLAKLNAGTQVYFCGSQSPAQIREDIDAVDLWADEQMQVENAWLTAEGAISAALQRSKLALVDCRCLVIGWGRIGRALTEMLVGLQAHVTVASRSMSGQNGAIERGAETVDTNEIANALPDQQIIFSTPPRMVLDAAALKFVSPDALIIDLASPPYGVDLDAALALGLQAWREPKLPGRYCPYSAALVLLRALSRKLALVPQEKEEL